MSVQARLKFPENKSTKHSYNGNAISTPWEGTQEMLRDQNRDDTQFADIVLNKPPNYRCVPNKDQFKNSGYLENRAYVPFVGN